MVAEVASKTNDIAVTGNNCNCSWTQAIVREGLKNVTSWLPIQSVSVVGLKQL